MTKVEKPMRLLVNNFDEINASTLSEAVLTNNGYELLGVFETSEEGLISLNEELNDLEFEINTSQLVKLLGDQGITVLFKRKQPTEKSDVSAPETRVGFLHPYQKTDDPEILRSLGFTPYKNETYLSVGEISKALAEIRALRGEAPFRFRKIAVKAASSKQNSAPFSVQIFVDFES
jgi:hypothetical protein